MGREHIKVPSYDIQYLDKLDFDISIFPGKKFILDDFLNLNFKTNQRSLTV